MTSFFFSPEENNLTQTALQKGYTHLHSHQQWIKICFNSVWPHCTLPFILTFVNLKRKKYFPLILLHILFLMKPSFKICAFTIFVFSPKTSYVLCYIFLLGFTFFFLIDSQEFFIFSYTFTTQFRKGMWKLRPFFFIMYVANVLNCILNCVW